jgi:hypothetical protein
MSKPRAKAPKANIKTGHRDIRAEIIDDLNEKNPDFVHSFQDVKLMKPEMAHMDMEWVKNNTYDKENEDSETMTWRRDGIVRIPKEISVARSNAAGEESAESVESLYCRDGAGNDEWKKNTVGRRVRTPKDPTKIGNIGGM